MAHTDEQSLKRIVGERAVAEFIHDDMAIGLGAGSTAIWAVRAIASLYRKGELTNIRCGCTGPGTRLEASHERLPWFELNHSAILDFDVTIDGADEYDNDGNLVKGGGGCLLHEKIVAYSSKKLVIVVGANKHAVQLGIQFPVAVEVIPQALSRVQGAICNTFLVANSTLRKDARNIGPWITEEGNYILDISFSGTFSPVEYEHDLNQITGVVDNGFFTKKKPTLMIVHDDGTIDIKDFQHS